MTEKAQTKRSAKQTSRTDPRDTIENVLDRFDAVDLFNASKRRFLDAISSVCTRIVATEVLRRVERKRLKTLLAIKMNTKENREKRQKDIARLRRSIKEHTKQLKILNERTMQIESARKNFYDGADEMLRLWDE